MSTPDPTADLPVNPTRLGWVNPTQNEDGTPFDPSLTLGYSVLFDDEAAVSYPSALVSQMDLREVEVYRSLRTGIHKTQIAIIIRAGTDKELRSEYSDPVFFRKQVAPLAPTDLVVD